MRLGLVLWAIAIGWLLTHTAQASTYITYLTAEPSSGYEATRLYAGKTVPARASELGFSVGGEIASLAVDIGDRVRRGQLLAELDTDALMAALRSADANVDLALANRQALAVDLELAAQTEARIRTLCDRGHASAQVYDEQRLNLKVKRAQLAVAEATLVRAEAARDAARVAVEDAQIRAPYDGIIQHRYVDEGAQRRPGMPVVRLVQVTGKEAHVGIPESMRAAIEQNPTHTVRWRGMPYQASLKTVLPEVDPDTRTLNVILELDAETIPLGVVIELELEQHVDEPGYWVPVAALTESERGLWAVFVVNDQSAAERRLVEILHTEAEQAFVRGTLSPGDRVVSTGVQRLVPGQQVALATGI